jgi:hypothetical protein
MKTNDLAFEGKESVQSIFIKKVKINSLSKKSLFSPQLALKNPRWKKKKKKKGASSLFKLFLVISKDQSLRLTMY